LSVSSVPEIVDWSVVDERIVLDDAEAFAAARALASEEGIFAGISSGTAVAAARRVGRALAARAARAGAARETPAIRVVTVLPDRGERYLSTPLFDPAL